MCLLVLLNHVVAGYPLVVAANRDEDPARGGDPPGRWPDGIVAPRDPKAGGTWIGVNAHGVVSAVTNRAGPLAAGPQVKSRGGLPLEALKEKTAMAARRRAERIPTFLFSPFNWLYADVHHAFIDEHGGPSDISVRLRPGLHALTNLHDVNQVNLDALVNFLAVESDHPALSDVIPQLQDMLGCHEPLLSDTHQICKHEGLPRTLSASIIAIHESDRGSHRWLYHDGPPCRGPWLDVSELLV